MKVLCSQEVVRRYRCGAVPCQVTAKASAPQVPWFVLGLWLQKGPQENMAWFEHIDFYAFSRGSFRKPARNLIEIAQRKSQDIFPMSMRPEDWREFRRFLQKKDGIEVYLLRGETFEDLKQRIQRIVQDSFLRSLSVEIREQNGRYFAWLVW